ncbi:hypothetical protein HDC92_005001 [Pedobacter sp. AK017]|nr:hypothetical protein [Pedobacter sp. AK017]
MANGTSQDYMQVFKITQNFTSPNVNDFYERHGATPLNSDVTGVIWRMNYADLGLNVEDMIKDGIDKKKYEYVGIGYAIKAWSFQMTTDMYGEIILDEAFNPEQLTFAYQSQKEVYERVREWNNLAIKYLNMKGPVDYTSVLAGPSGDFIYRGDMDKWKKFVYGNLALHYSHLINKPNFANTYADSVLKYVDLSLASSSEDATVKFSATSSEDSNVLGPLWGIITSTGIPTGRISSTILNLLTGGVRGVPAVDTTASIDPRLSRMLSPVPVPIPGDLGIYRGNTPTKGTVAITGVPATPHVLGPVLGPVTDPYPGKYIFSNSSQYPLLSYAQLQFTKAEALFIKANKPLAFLAYQNAIRAHMSFVNLYGTAGPDFKAITSAEIERYMTSSEVAQTSAELKISDIMNQKYIAQWGWAGMEQWCDLRKYHYNPAVFTQYYQLSGTEFATNNNGKYAYRHRPRFNSEYAWNASEVERVGGKLPDYNTKETWFSTVDN